MGRASAGWTARSSEDTALLRRDAALLAVLFSAGVRTPDAVALDAEDYASGALLIPTKRGPGRRRRLAPDVIDALEVWLKIRGDAPGPLFTPMTGAKPVIRRLRDSDLTQDLQSRHPAAVYLFSLATGSRRTMAGALMEIGEILEPGSSGLARDWSQVGYADTQAVRSTLTERHAPATVNKMLSALRRVLKEAWRLGQMDAETFHAAADVPSVRSTTGLRGRGLTSTELEGLFEACRSDDSPAGVRDAALLAVLYGAGVRRAEAVAFTLADLDRDTGELRVRAGKGRKDRTTYLPEGALEAVGAWLGVRGDDPGPLLLRISKAGNVSAGVQHLTGQAVLEILRKRALQAGVERFSPHDLRRSYISDLLDAGADIVTVQRLAGHSVVTTTARYDRRLEDTKAAASQRLRVPYRRRETKSRPATDGNEDAHS
jgi:integrase/recombinase XerD